MATTSERCPRCGHDIEEGGVRPALSRWDDTTHVCAWCGEHEALLQAFDGGLRERDEWWDRYTGGPVGDYRLVLVARGSRADKVTLDVTLAERRFREEQGR